MINYAVNKYGKDKVAQIITFGTLGARAAIRDTGRALDIPLSDVDRVAKLVPNVPGKPVKIGEAIEQIPELKELYDSTDWVKTLLDTAQTVEGTVRNIGTHAAGVVISDRPLVEYTPLAPPDQRERQLARIDHAVRNGRRRCDRAAEGRLPGTCDVDHHAQGVRSDQAESRRRPESEQHSRSTIAPPFS